MTDDELVALSFPVFAALKRGLDELDGRQVIIGVTNAPARTPDDVAEDLERHKRRNGMR